MRNHVVGLLLILAGVVALAAQQPPPPTPAPAPPQQPVKPGPTSQPAAPATPQPVNRVFGSEAGMIFNPIKPDKTADFENVMARLKDALTQSEDPVRKQQAAGWKVFK